MNNRKDELKQQDLSALLHTTQISSDLTNQMLKATDAAIKKELEKNQALAANTKRVSVQATLNQDTMSDLKEISSELAKTSKDFAKLNLSLNLLGKQHNSANQALYLQALEQHVNNLTTTNHAAKKAAAELNLVGRGIPSAALATKLDGLLQNAYNQSLKLKSYTKDTIAHINDEKSTRRLKP